MASTEPKIRDAGRSSARRALTTIILVLLAGTAGYQLASREKPSRNDVGPPLTLNPKFMTKHPVDIHPGDLVTIRSAADADAARQRLLQILWGRPELPDDVPSVEPSFLDERQAERFAAATESIEAFVVEMDAGLVTRALHFVPRERNGGVVILHDGHDESFLAREHEIELLLERGFAVIGLSMPLVPPNSQPDLTLDTGEVIRLSEHEQLKYVPPSEGHPVKYLIEPVIRVLNHIERKTDYGDISMIGVSGGGWTTVMAAAIDPRIRVSVPVAGSFPIYLRAMNERDWGDWEETLPDIFGQVSYIDLYILGSSGCGRRQAQVFYEFDPCCYAGTAPRVWEDAVEEAANALDGSFRVVIDSHYHQHGYSDVAMRAALEAIERRPSAPCR